MSRYSDPDFSFNDLPVPGLRLRTRHGYQYLLLAVQPYTRRSDGAATHVLIWSGMCADCGSSFECRSSAKADQLQRRCDLCKRGKSNQPANASALATLVNTRNANLAKGRAGRARAKRISIEERLKQPSTIPEARRREFHEHMDRLEDEKLARQAAERIRREMLE